MEQKKNIWKAVVVTAIFVAALAGWFGYQKYKAFLLPNVKSDLADPFLYIPTGATFDDVVRILDSLQILKNIESFKEVAAQMNYAKPAMRAGRFKIEVGWNNKSLVQHLRSGEQAPVKLVLNNERLLEDVAQKVARFIESDSASLMALFQNDTYLADLGYNQQTLMALFIPNTYEFFWNTSPEQFMERMIREHDAFWSKNDRKAKADSLNLSLSEVYTLASIVERETNQNTEKQRMAGVYLNRLRINMLLQADPTCVFATRDFGAKRVLDYHKFFDSPYNTYLYVGLPPGPISMASIPSLDAVLNYEKHDYLYFCAKPDGSGFHTFAKTLAQHNVNAALYRESLRNQ